MAPKMKTRCKWCEEGREPNENGEHWIVTSIIPARIKIEKCKIEFAKKPYDLKIER